MIMKTVLYSDDINLVDYWNRSLNNEAIVVEDVKELEKIENAVIVVNYCALNAQKDLLKTLLQNNDRVLVLHRVPTLETAKKLLKEGVFGYGNAMMKEHFLRAAIDTIKEGMVWLYPTFTSQLIQEIPKSQKNLDRILADLTAREKEVALLLKEGESYKEIAQKLGISARTVKAHASKVYEKLGVSDRLALALLLK